jgi:aminoglycoside phosphotransferase (APT) family kinase protein
MDRGREGEPLFVDWIPEAPAAIPWIQRAVGPGARVVRVEAMPPSSTTMHLAEVALPDGSIRSLVLRRYHDATRLANDPWYLPAHEAVALRLMAGTSVPAPHLYAADLQAEVCGAPALLESWLPGRPTWQPVNIDRYLADAAEVLVAIHGVNVPAGSGLSAYAPYYDWQKVASPDFFTRRGLWERVAEVLAAPRPAHRETFIHRDYHPGNILWDGSHATGVVDWATAAWGPAGIDLARMRQNLAIHLGRDVADRFTMAYRAAGGSPSARAPYWDLLDAADLLPDIAPLAAPGSRELERFEDYVEGVLAEC